MPPDIAQNASPQGTGNFVVQIVGDGNTVHYDPGKPALWLTTYDTPGYAEPATIPPTATPEPGYTPTGIEEAGLLRPYARSFTLRGRDEMLADLRAWRDAAAPISAVVLTGAGGRGKTRLALELCAEAAAAGWLAGFVTHGEMERFAAQTALGAWGWNRPVLAVVDYAAGKARALRRWLEALTLNPALNTAPDQPAHPRLRLLLLNREGDAGSLWWKEAFGEGGAAAAAIRRLLVRAEPLRLDPIAATEHRQAIFTEAYRRARGEDPPPLMQADRMLLAQSLGGEPLFLAMSGLIAAKQGVDFALRLRADELALRLAGDELDRIGRIWRGRGLPDGADPPLPARIAAAATAAKGIGGKPAAQALCQAEATAAGLVLAGGPEPARAAMNAALPEPGGGIAAIEPDILGEAVLVLSWGDTSDGLDALRRISAAHRAEATEVVIRACQDFLIRGERRPLAWLELLRAEAADLEALMRLSDSMPQESLELREVAMNLAEILVMAARSLPAEAGELRAALLSGSLGNLSNRLADLGRREAALAAIEEALAIHRDLAAARPDAYRRELAASLGNLSNRLADLGRRATALAAIEEALAIHRDLAAARPDAFLPDLALSLNNLSNRLSDLSRPEAALAAIEEAVAIRRDLAAACPDTFLPNLAVSLNNLSVRLSALNRWEAALAANEEAVAIYRDLAAARPDAFLPNLAVSLNNLSVKLSILGRREAALAAIEEAVATRRDLAAVRPDAFLPDLATSFGARGHVLKTQNPGEAARSFAEGIVALRPLFLALPPAFASLMGALCQDHIAACEAAGHEPDMALLAPIIAAFETLSGPDSATKKES